MEYTTRIPPAEITGVKGALIKQSRSGRARL
jgi:hypothetical protein